MSRSDFSHGILTILMMMLIYIFFKYMVIETFPKANKCPLYSTKKLARIIIIVMRIPRLTSSLLIIVI